MLILRMVLVSAVILCTMGCALCPPKDNHYETIKSLDDSLLMLSRAVDVVIDSLPVDAEDDAIFRAVRERSGDNSLFEPFAQYKLKAKIDQGYALILLCTQDGKYSLIEDASCTQRIDTWRPLGSPCKYFLDIKKICI